MTKVSGKVAVVTGASRGLGAGLAQRFADRGLRLGLCARTASALAPSAEILTERVDVVDADAVRRFADAVVQRFGRIDLWINNAGILEPIAPLRDVSSAEFETHLRVNVLGVVHGTQAFVDHVRGREGEGVLINVSSGAARKPYEGWSAYCASKAAVDRLTECVAAEEAASGLRAHAVAPGVIDTDMQALIRASTRESFPDLDRFVQMKRDGAFNTPGFIADEFLQLAFAAERESEVLLRLPNEN